MWVARHVRCVFVVSCDGAHVVGSLPMSTHTALAIGVSCMLASCAEAQDLGSLEWWADAWARADAVELPSASFIDYSIETRVAGDQDTLEQLASIVEDRPDHPLRDQYDTLKRQLAEGPDTTRFRLWFDSRTRWRLAQDLHAGVPLPYVDVALDGTSAWKMNERRLHVIDPRRPPEGLDPNGHIGALPSYFRWWVSSGFGSGPLSIEPVEVSVDGRAWVGRTRAGDGHREYEFRGTIDPDNGLVRIHESEVIRSDDNAQWIGNVTRYEDWRFIESLGWVASRVSKVDSEGLEYLSVVLNEFRPLDPGEIAPLLALPTPTSVDPVRGPSTFVAIDDHTPGRHRSTNMAAGDITALPTESRSSPPAWLQAAGWIGAACVVSAIVWLRVRRRAA